MGRHPLTIFLVVGALLFAVDRWRSTESIVIDEAVAERVAGLWETQMGTPPDPETLDALLAAWLREEVFYREALRRGLDADDTVLRRRLVQKLEFLVQDMTSGTVSEGNLDAYFEEHRERYRLPERWTFEQHQYATAAEAEAALEALRQGEAFPRGLEDLPRHFVGKSQAELQQALGSALASALPEVPLNQWVGPAGKPLWKPPSAPRGPPSGGGTAPGLRGPAGADRLSPGCPRGQPRSFLPIGARTLWR